MTCHCALPTLQILIHQNLLIMPSQIWLPCDHSRLNWKFKVIKMELFCTSLFMRNVLVMLELTPLIAMRTLQRVRTGV
jgi:hypothetical protein